MQRPSGFIKIMENEKTGPFFEKYHCFQRFPVIKYSYHFTAMAVGNLLRMEKVL